MGYDHAYMIEYAELAKTSSENSNRIEVLNTMISIVRSIDEAQRKYTDRY